jgi:asparagine synthase (glutamine-hydrolysing)
MQIFAKGIKLLDELALSFLHKEIDDVPFFHESFRNVCGYLFRSERRFNRSYVDCEAHSLHCSVVSYVQRQVAPALIETPAIAPHGILPETLSVETLSVRADVTDRVLFNAGLATPLWIEARLSLQKTTAWSMSAALSMAERERASKMCGIAGFLNRSSGFDDGGLSRLVTAMSNTLRHRGPDADGVWTDAEQGVALGHRRLSILDLSQAGAQPMRSASGRYVVTYNGEIYNFKTLQAELAAAGYAFRGHSDTEVLLAAVDHWGVRPMLERIRGMFAFALWDRAERVLTLARDHVGKKPLYYGWCGETFLFASELRALRCHPDFVDTVDRDALGQFIQNGAIAQPASIYESVRKLPPGAFVQIAPTTQCGTIQPESFWSAKKTAEDAWNNPFSGGYEEALDRIEDLLKQSVADRLASDVPLGALLSGGVDSTVVVALMKAITDQPVKTFCIGFSEPKYNEANYAADIAAHLNTDHHELYVSANRGLELVGRLADIYDEPFADVSQIPTFLVSQMARQNVTVALSGDGGDELFLGYNHYFECLGQWRRLRRLPLSLRTAVGTIIGAIGRESWNITRPRHSRATDKLPGWRRLGGKLEREARGWPAAVPRELLARNFARCVDAGDLVLGTGPAVPAPGDEARWAEIPDDLRAMSLFDYGRYLPDDILVKVDRASMAVSLEVRCPLLDTRIADFAWSLPRPFLVDRRGGKRILKDVLARYVPRELTERPKRGFGVPVAEWLRGPLRSWAEDLIAEPFLQNQNIFDAKAVRRVWEQHLCGWRNHANLLWAVLMFQTWWTQYEKPTKST